jgi:hypothetical protein
MNGGSNIFGTIECVCGGAFKSKNLGHASATPYHFAASIFHCGDVSRIFTAIVSYF